MRVYIASNSTPSEAELEEGRKHNETWATYPDDHPKRQDVPCCPARLPRWGLGNGEGVLGLRLREAGSVATGWGLDSQGRAT